MSNQDTFVLFCISFVRWHWYDSKQTDAS